MNKFLNYNSIQFLSDDSFISWLKKSDKITVEFWEGFIKSYPEKKEDIDEAIELYNYFKAAHNKLPIEDIFSLWDTIQHQSTHKKRSLVLKVLKYAAIFVFMFSAGAVSYHLFESKNMHNFPLAGQTQLNTQEAQIILSNGKSVLLYQKDSKIEFDSTGANIVVNSDTILLDPNVGSAEMNRVIIPYGKSSQVTLSDGTKVWLNAGSQLLYPSKFTGKIREVLLVGEAFFEVTRNEANPFMVRTEFIDIEVLGTKFDVSAYSEDKIFETVLVSGSVSVELKKTGIFAGKEKITLRPNQRLTVDKEEGKSEVSEVNTSFYTAWKDGMLEFEKEDLNRILLKLERYYNKRINIKDPMLGIQRISGKLDLKDSLADVLSIIQFTVPLNLNELPNGDFVITNQK